MLQQSNPNIASKSHGLNIFSRVVKNVKRDKFLIILVIPMIIYYIVFHYIPMYGVIIAFKDFSIRDGIIGSQWVGLENFKVFTSSIYFWRLLKNTFLMGVFQLLWGFPVPIIFALMLNEVRSFTYKRIVQTVSYMPHFISVVVIVGILVNFLSPNNGVINSILKSFGKDPVNFMYEVKWFRTLYIGSGIWQNFGWGSIIYIAAISNIEQSMYEAAHIDGADRFKQIIHITLPSLAPTIIMMFILRMGNIMSIGFEKILLMSSPATYEVSDVIATYTYRIGINGGDFSIGAAAGLFNSVINFIMLVAVNRISRKVSESSLW